MQVGIFGASGRMGRLLVQEVCADSALRLSSVYARDDRESLLALNLPVARDSEEFLESCACVIDFF